MTTDDRGSDSREMSRWQGQVEAQLDAMAKDLLERDKRYDERAEAQNKAVEAALAAQKEAVAAALAASDKAVSVAEANAEKWRANANEWRGAMDDRDKKLPSRGEVDSSMRALNDRLNRLEALAEREAGQANAQVVTEERGDRHRDVTDAATARLYLLAGVAVGIAGIIAGRF